MTEPGDCFLISEALGVSSDIVDDMLKELQLLSMSGEYVPWVIEQYSKGYDTVSVLRGVFLAEYLMWSDRNRQQLAEQELDHAELY